MKKVGKRYSLHLSWEFKKVKIFASCGLQLKICRMYHTNPFIVVFNMPRGKLESSCKNKKKHSFLNGPKRKERQTK